MSMFGTRSKKVMVLHGSPTEIGYDGLVSVTSTQFSHPISRRFHTCAARVDPGTTSTAAGHPRRDSPDEVGLVAREEPPEVGLTSVVGPLEFDQCVGQSAGV